MLLEAIREKALQDIKAQHAAQQIFNMTGSTGSGAGSPVSSGLTSGVGSAMSGADTMSPEDFDYMVSIDRRDSPDINPATGKPNGWTKNVHRYRTPKGEGKDKHGKK
jgi:hypothetical protein